MAKILIAEDERDIRDLITFTLTFAGHEVIATPNGEEAYLKSQEFTPDLIMMDVRLSGKDGLVLLKQLRSHPNLKVANTPVLMMSAGDHKLQSRSAGANGFIEKPFDWEVLRGAIERIMEGLSKD